MADDVIEAGQVFGRYVVQRRLGVGTYGAVYEALMQPLNTRFALKVLHASQVKIPEAVDRFFLEAKATAQLDHPNIVKVIDLGEVDGQPFISMEFLEGETLSQRLKRGGRLSPTEAVDLLLPIFAAVVAVHGKGIVHRDLKPSNIFLARERDGQERVKLLDFGIAKVSDTDHSMTRTGAMMGSPHYMSPEQAHESRDVDARADQWALGVILYECLAGRRPFTGGSLVEVLSGVARDRPPPLPEGVDAPLLERVIFRAIEKKRENRFASVREMGAELLPLASESVARSCAAELGTAPTTVAPPPRAPDAPAREAEAPGDALASLPVSARDIAPPPAASATRRRYAIAAAIALAVAGLATLGGRLTTASTPSPASSTRRGEALPLAPSALELQRDASHPAEPAAVLFPSPPPPSLAAPPPQLAALPPTVATPTVAAPRAGARSPAPRRVRTERVRQEPGFTSTGIQIH